MGTLQDDVVVSGKPSTPKTLTPELLDLPALLREPASKGSELVLCERQAHR